MNTLTDSIQRLLFDVSAQREKIKEDFIKTWLAVNIPDKNLNIDYLVNNVVIYEQWHRDPPMRVTWSLRLKEPPHSENLK